ncbi:MAG: hypothetical protein EBS96_09165 [Spartobacteria bacterium]|nr:hypothetical protein [Spartobacteria bacterium]
MFMELQTTHFQCPLTRSLPLASLRANLRLLYLKGPAFSIVVNHAESWFKNPQGCGKIHAMLGQIGRFLGRVEFQLYASNVCRMDSHVKPPSGGLSLGSANVPVGFARHVTGPRRTSPAPKKMILPSMILSTLPSAISEGGAPSAPFRLPHFPLTEPRGTQRSFRFSARQHFHSAPLRASA